MHLGANTTYDLPNCIRPFRVVSYLLIDPTVPFSFSCTGEGEGKGATELQCVCGQTHRHSERVPTVHRAGKRAAFSSSTTLLLPAIVISG